MVEAFDFVAGFLATFFTPALGVARFAVAAGGFIGAWVVALAGSVVADLAAVLTDDLAVVLAAVFVEGLVPVLALDLAVVLAAVFVAALAGGLVAGLAADLVIALAAGFFGALLVPRATLVVGAFAGVFVGSFLAALLAFLAPDLVDAALVDAAVVVSGPPFLAADVDAEVAPLSAMLGPFRMAGRPQRDMDMWRENKAIRCSSQWETPRWVRLVP